jgi:hypothetical protein
VAEISPCAIIGSVSMMGCFGAVDACLDADLEFGTGVMCELRCASPTVVTNTTASAAQQPVRPRAARGCLESEVSLLARVMTRIPSLSDLHRRLQVNETVFSVIHCLKSRECAAMALENSDSSLIAAIGMTRGAVFNREQGGGEEWEEIACRRSNDSPGRSR